MPLCRTMIRTIIISAVVLGTTGAAIALVAGPERASMFAGALQDRVQSSIDAHIDDPTALRAQLRKLEAEYPERISDLTGDLAEVEHQMAQLERERSISERVVELAAADLEQVEQQLATARTDGAALASYGGRDGRSYPLEKAMTRASQLRQTQAVYASRAQDAQRDLGYLELQASRMRDTLAQLESEHAQFEAQLWQIERQVDAIARNERLIEMMEERQRELDDHDRYQAASLDQLTGRLTELRTRQEAQLEHLSKAQNQISYEDLARMQLETERIEIEVQAEAGFELMPIRGELR